MSEPALQLIVADVLAGLADLADESVDCCITSPPYWGLRDYGAEGQIGLEATPDEYVTRIVTVFREVRRVLAPHGTCWINLGDSYAQTSGRTDRKGTSEGDSSGIGGAKTSAAVGGLKPKDLVGIPWRVAFALQQDGWYLRADIIWAKSNPMPESVTDRPTKAHEYVFLLSKSPRYFFDQEAVRERAEWARWGDQTVPKHAGTDTAAGWIKPKTKQELVGKRTYDGFNGRWDEAVASGNAPTGRNIRSVWEIATQPYPEAHFATYPEELVRRALLAGCPERVCRVCGKPRERLTDVSYGKSPVHGAGSVVGRHEATGQNNYDGAGMPRLSKQVETVGWSDCGHDNYRPGTVLDPFLGSGTTAVVAMRHKRDAIGIELNPEYAELARKRVERWWMKPARSRIEAPQEQTLFDLE